MTELIFQKGLMLIKQIYQKSLIDYFENDKERLREQARGIETYLKKKKIKKENMEKMDISICLKKRKKD